MKLGLRELDYWPIGKHKGKKLSELPTQYLVWVVFESNFNDQSLINKARKELDARDELDFDNIVSEMARGLMDDLPSLEDF